MVKPKPAKPERKLKSDHHPFVTLNIPFFHHSIIPSGV
ncbi:hypothetical protein D1AOALGA4SA_12587 [Olavius algarvensis Delta 1 endosymbiont]|nr:hypothetical protein D1AOALGA4SA_12587 [Olavius algarvensis Delta 1 endosymbiont]